MCSKKLCCMAFLFVAAAGSAAVSAADGPNWAQELVGPVEGTEVHHNETSEFGRYMFVTGPEARGAIAKTASVEGKKSEISYRAPGKTPFEIYSIYKKFFADKGYETLFACEGKVCGQNFRGVWYGLNPFENNPGWDNSAPITNGSWESQFYIAARKKSAAGDIYAAVFTNSGWWNYPVYRVDVARPAALGSGVVPASRIAEALGADGRIAFYGITFDTGSSVIKTESEPTLAEIAAFLKTARGETFYVVGHTDGVGSLADNLKLAQDRASAVKATLIDKYGVPAVMLSAHGAGPLSPVATNYTEEGRALNRRVEIVKALKTGAAGAGMPAAQAVPQQTPAQAAQAQIQAAQQQQAQAAAQMQAAQQAAQAQAAQAAAAAQAQPAPVPPPAPEEGLIPVPDVKGKLFLVGQNMLVSQGFKVNRTGKLTGFIRAQNPPPNTRVKKGSTVTITVGN